MNGPIIFPVVVRVSQSVRTKPLWEESVSLTNLSTDQNKTNQPTKQKLNTFQTTKKPLNPQNKKPQNPSNKKKANNSQHNPNLQTPKKPTLVKQLKHQTLLRNNLISQSLPVTKTSLQSLWDSVYVCAFIIRFRQMVCVISLN